MLSKDFLLYLILYPLLLCFLKMCILFIFGFIATLSSVQSFSRPWTAAYQASLSVTNSQSLLTSIESVLAPLGLSLAEASRGYTVVAVCRLLTVVAPLVADRGL